MKKTSIVLCACLLLAAGGWAQTSIDPAELNPALLDFSQARATIAGPDLIYIRSIYYGAEEVSVLLRYDGEAGADVVGIYTAGDKVIPDTYVAEYAAIEPILPASIRIKGVIGGGAAYAGTLQWTPGTNKLSLVGGLETVSMPDTAESLRAQLMEEKLVSADLRLEMATLQEEMAALQQEYASLQEENASLQEKYASLAAAPAVSAGLEKPDRLVHEGFAGGSALAGSWKVSADAVSQRDSSTRFAKYALPLPQGDTEALYEFTARADASGWVGYGLHFLASGSERGRGYGFGSSYLVWLTRDPSYYKSEDTYVQLYRSYDDVRMIQLASVSIPESIDAELSTEVLYDPDGGTIAVSVDGVERLRYTVDQALAGGDQVALRVLGGPVDFSAFSLKTR